MLFDEREKTVKGSLMVPNDLHDYFGWPIRCALRDQTCFDALLYKDGRDTLVDLVDVFDDAGLNRPFARKLRSELPYRVDLL